MPLQLTQRVPLLLGPLARRRRDAFRGGLRAMPPRVMHGRPGDGGRSIGPVPPSHPRIPDHSDDTTPGNPASSAAAESKMCPARCAKLAVWYTAHIAFSSPPPLTTRRDRDAPCELEGKRRGHEPLRLFETGEPGKWEPSLK